MSEESIISRVENLLVSLTHTAPDFNSLELMPIIPLARIGLEVTPKPIGEAYDGQIIIGIKQNEFKIGFIKFQLLDGEKVGFSFIADGSTNFEPNYFVPVAAIPSVKPVE